MHNDLLYQKLYWVNAQIFAVYCHLYLIVQQLYGQQKLHYNSHKLIEAKLFITASKEFFKFIQYTIFEHLRYHRAYCYTSEVLTRAF